MALTFSTGSSCDVSVNATNRNFGQRRLLYTQLDTLILIKYTMNYVTRCDEGLR
jgi:hypothetical protein